VVKEYLYDRVPSKQKKRGPKLRTRHVQQRNLHEGVTIAAFRDAVIQGAGLQNQGRDPRRGGKQ
jgi:hypothetical protein